jgi:hypothetical protein
MPHEPKNLPDPIHEDGKMREDEPIPSASDDKVIEETARLVREGRKEKQAGGGTSDDEEGPLRSPE